MKKGYKIIILCLIMFISFFASGCKSVESDISGIKNLVQQQLYEQKEDRYLVFIYRANCDDCESVKAVVVEYAKAQKNNLKSRKIYGFNLSNEKNCETNIYRIRKDGDGQGQVTSDGVLYKKAFYVDGVTKWDDLYIAGTAALISIKEKDGVKYSYFLCSGALNITEYLKEELNRK